MENGLEDRMENSLSKAADKIDPNWVLLDSESKLILG